MQQQFFLYKKTTFDVKNCTGKICAKIYGKYFVYKQKKYWNAGLLISYRPK